MEDKINNQESKEEKPIQHMERLDLDQSLIPTSPYYIHPGENLGQVLTTPSLNETNYNSWSRNMRRALLSKNKLKFVDGNIKTPARDDPLYETWERANVMVLSWIVRTLSPQIAESVIYIESARDLWKDLKERFTKGDYFRISDLLQEIHSAKQGERNITQFFTDIKTIWEELEFLRPVPNCVCGKSCDCNISKIFIKQREVEYVICFLKGLNDSYNTMKTQILLLDPLPNINKVYSLIMQQERQNNGSTNLGTEGKTLFNASERHGKSQDQGNWRGQGRGFMPRSQGRGRGRNPNYGKQCFYCHKMNHTVEECYSKHGYPHWYKQRNDGSNNTQERGSQEKRERQVCNLNIKEDSVDKQQPVRDESTKGFTAEQMQRLLRLLDDTEGTGHNINQIQRRDNDSSRNSQGKNLWILDTGATDHVTHNKNCFTTFFKIKPIKIKLPNNNDVTAQFAGTVQFCADLILFNVLYVPEFHFNLISV